MSKKNFPMANNVALQDFPEPPSVGRHPQRIYYLDVLRVLSIFGVIAMHAVDISRTDLSDMRTWWIGHALITFSYFGVPVLVMISGAILLSPEKRLDVIPFYKKRLPKIVIPLIAWSFIYYIRDVLDGVTFWLPTFFKRLLTGSWAGHLWFLYMMICIYFMTPFIRKMFVGDGKNEDMRLAKTFLILYFLYNAFLFFVEMAYQSHPSYYMREALFSFYMFYFVLGYYIRRSDFPKSIGLMLSPPLFFIGGILTFWSYYQYSIVLRSRWPAFFDFGTPFVMLMAFAIFLFFKSLTYRDSRFMRAVIYVSKMSYGIYLCHMLVLDVFSGQLLPIFDGTLLPPFSIRSFEPLLSGPLLIVVTFAISLLITMGLHRVRWLRWLVP
ncbi:hypothetical protein DQK91_07175 [Oceanidesulfovibrio marinus]|uniref:Acyltransferase 3 domain-containing protein n=2 Tax=Oceanidesulfovibrio marinus TaxID=370038 RepID=A0A6P1ZML1_9BACT|nr:hypothetical protein DQK91_07175 [Oceanidesulfovibrio marinus]